MEITAQSAFDYDGVAEHNGGTIIVNGEEIDEITNQFGGGMGPMGGEAPQGFEKGNPPEGFDPENLPEGFEPGQRPERPSGRGGEN